MGISNYLSPQELTTLNYDEFFQRKVCIIHISLWSRAGSLITEWLTANKQLILSTSKDSTDNKWGGREWSRNYETAYFRLESQFSDGCPNGAIITPTYQVKDSLTDTQINDTPTIAELYFGIIKKYPNEVQSISAQYKPEIDNETYFSWMHPKELRQKLD